MAPTPWLIRALASQKQNNPATKLWDILAKYATEIELKANWQTWAGPILHANGGGLALGGGATETCIYKHNGYDVDVDFVSVWGNSTGRSEGSGFHRINLPVASDPWYNANEGMIGSGHVHSKNIGSGLGPQSIFHVQFHCAPSLTNTQAGIIIPSNSSGSLLDNWTATANPLTASGGIKTGDLYVGKLHYKSLNRAT